MSEHIMDEFEKWAKGQGYCCLKGENYCPSTVNAREGFKAGYEAATKEPSDPLETFKLIKDGIKQARKAFSDNPDDFGGALGDADLTAFIADNIFNHTRGR